MNKTVLKTGDEIRVIAPSASMGYKSPTHYKRAEMTLGSLGYKITYGKYAKRKERFGTASVQDRAEDLHAAYRDKQVKAIMAAHGGWSANALLPVIDWELLKANPKPFIGYSDITVLLNAIYAKTGNIGYLGPNFSSLGERSLVAYAKENLGMVLSGTAPYSLKKSDKWQQNNKGKTVRTASWKVLKEGEAHGILLGGNLGTFYLLQGTEYQPRFEEPFILAVEDDDEAGKFSRQEFDRRLESLLQLPNARKNIRGMLIGRFQPTSGVLMPDVTYVIDRLGLGSIPIIAGVDFGHTWPQLTLPIGGNILITATAKKSAINLLEW